jgi:hypothetical protein
MDKTPLLPINTQELSAVLFSASQQAFHIEPLKDYVKENVMICAIGDKGDYRLIGIFEDDLQADAYIEEFRKVLQNIKDKNYDRKESM